MELAFVEWKGYVLYDEETHFFQVWNGVLFVSEKNGGGKDQIPGIPGCNAISSNWTQPARKVLLLLTRAGS